MKVTTHKSEIVILVRDGHILNIFVPRFESASPQDFVAGSVISCELPLTVIDLGDKNETTARS